MPPVELALHLVGETAEWDVLAQVDEKARVADLAAALVDVIGHRPKLYRFGEVLDGTHALGDAGVRAGDTLGVDLPVAVDLRRFGPELHIVAGQGAGRRFRLTNRPVVVGRADDCDVVVGDGRASRRHLQLEWGDRAFSVVDLGSRNGTVVDGRALTPGAARLCSPGEFVLIGDTVITVRAEVPDGSATRPTGPFHLALTAGPSPDPLVEDAPIALPRRPAEAAPRRSLWMVAAPLAGVAAIGAAGAPPASIAAFASVPVVVAGALVAERVRIRRRSEDASRRHALLDAAARDEIARRLYALERHERLVWPDPAALGAAAARRSTLVWSHDQRARLVRVGLADRRRAVTVVATTDDDDNTTDACTARLVPHLVDLEAGPVALIGPERDLDDVAAWVVLQLVVLRPPGNVEVVVVSTEPDRWAWLALVPHATSVIDGRNPDDVRAQLGVGRPDGARLVVFDRLPDELVGALDLAVGRGDARLCRSAIPGLVPPGTTTTITAGTPGRIHVRSADGVHDVVPDAAGHDVALEAARCLSGLTVPSSQRARALPAEVRLVDLLGGAIDANAIAERWRRDRGTLDALLGVDGRGPVRIRLDGHNSHTLVAGSTGSGKTRLVETLVVSLAVNHAPDRFAFFIIDFKGGNELARLAALPHCAGFVSDRDRTQVDRAVRSLAREIARRDEVLAAAGAADLADFERRTGTPLSRLLVVADEFGQFRRDDADGTGVAALLRVAAQGRSKGVHLVLATQSPSTDVTADIRQNVAVRVCLRVAEAAESVAVLGTPDAARLPARPGRALLMRDGEVVEMQAALTRTPSAAQRPLVAVRTLRGATAPEASSAPPTDDDLSRLSAAMSVAAQAIGVTAAPLLAPALLDDQPRSAAPGAGRSWTLGGLVLGVLDKPGASGPAPLTFDPIAHGTMVVGGGPRSGRTTALLAAAEAARHQADADRRLVVHAVDWASPGLDSLRGAALDAGVVERGDLEHLRRLFNWLRTTGVPGVTRLVLIDRIDTLLHDCRDLDGGAFAADVVALLNDGPGRGVHTIVTVDAAGLAAGPVARLGGPRLVLPLADPAQAAVAGLPRRGPAPPGRAMLVPGGIEGHVGRPAPAERGGAVPSPGRVEPLPDVVALDALGPAPAEHVIVGLGGMGVLEPVTVDLDAAGPVIVVLGRAGSGRSTALAALAASYTGRRHVVELGDALMSSTWDELLAGPASVFVVDNEPAARARAPGLAAPDLAEQLVARGHVLIAGFDQGDLSSLGFGHWLMRRPRPGLLLSLDASADRLIACERVAFAPPPELRAGPPGRGWWCHRGAGTSVQVAQRPDPALPVRS